MIEFTLVILSALLAVPVVVLFVQVAMAFSSNKTTNIEVPDNGVSEKRASVAVLVPAHDEEFVIGESLSALESQLNDDDRLIVIADNCSDKTAEIAIGLNAEVITRTDEKKRGKGYALDFGINYLKQKNYKPEVVIVIDADCKVQKDCIDRLTYQCTNTGQPAQALYLMKSNSNKLGRKIAEFAWIVKNQVRPLGYLRLGLPCQLTGTGMAFPYRLIVAADLANAELVEDMKLGLNMARKGYSPMFCPGATVVSYFPGEEQGINSQRTRWEHGHLGTIFTEAPGLLSLSLKKRDFTLLAMGLDLLVPPLALLSILLAAVLVTTGIYALLTVSTVPLFIILGSSLVFTLSVLLALQGFARHVLSMKDLLGVPVYIARKIPLYLRFWTRRQKDWIRTERN